MSLSAAEGTGHVVSVLGDVAGAATQTRASAEVVCNASEAVDHAVSDLRLEVEDFLGNGGVDRDRLMLEHFQSWPGMAIEPKAIPL